MSSAEQIEFRPLGANGFGVCASVKSSASLPAFDALLNSAEVLQQQLQDAGGLMLIRGLGSISSNPDQLVALSRIFGSEVENYRETLTAARFFHDAVPEILVLSNLPPCNHPPPPRPDPPQSSAGKTPVQFPERKNWHTDQSYRRPPPDITLLYGVLTPPADQGQTMFADCTAAYEALDEDMKRRLAGLYGLHAPGWVGRTPDDVRAGNSPKPLLPHQLPQRHPIVRVHPDTGKPALYICEEKQMDFVDGPIEGLETGPDGEGARLLQELLRHATRPEFVYVHEWQEGDLLIGDNRCLLHAATWYDAEAHDRLMWRTTVMGNPGAEYAGEAKSWLPAEGVKVMQGMEDA